MKTRTQESGVALLITLLVMTVLLGVSASLLNITLKQYIFSSIGLQSEMAFQAASAGMECMLYHDYDNFPTDSKFDIGKPNTNISCFGQAADSPTVSALTNGVRRDYQFTWGSPSVCSDISIYKFFELGTADGNTTGPDMSATLGQTNVFCSEDVTCTVIRSRGYNIGCGNILNPRTIERELTQRY